MAVSYKSFVTRKQLTNFNVGLYKKQDLLAFCHAHLKCISEIKPLVVKLFYAPVQLSLYFTTIYVL